MAKAIINDKLYDTEKATKLLTFRRYGVNTVEVWGYQMRLPYSHDADLYATAKRNFFEHDLSNGTIRALTESAARDIIREVDPDLYVTLFGEVEEA